MKNRKMDNVLREWEKGNFELDLSAAEAYWCRRYADCKDKGLDEIVIGAHECVHESEVAEMLEAAKALKIEYFVYASGYSSAFSVVNQMVKNGAKVGKFVVKTYEQERFGDTEVVEVAGLRINL